jgi:hypothetical protein
MGQNSMAIMKCIFTVLFHFDSGENLTTTGMDVNSINSVL